MIQLENVVLVDEQDNEVGVAEKLVTHVGGKLHRAVSVFLFNDRGQLLLQQRAFSKYHSGGLWTNTCCGHPRPGELPLAAAKRRLQEEMGIVCGLEKIFDFVYCAALDNELIEHEFDHVFVGYFEGEPNPDPEEAGGWRWADPEEILAEMEEHPERFTAWFKIILNRVLAEFARPAELCAQGGEVIASE